jgi:hypothetical protein
MEPAAKIATEIAAYVVSWAALVIGIWSLVVTFDDAARVEVRKQVTAWLTAEPSSGLAQGLAKILADSFDRVFGRRLWSLRAFWRSSLASAVWYAVIWSAWAGLHASTVSDAYRESSLWDLGALAWLSIVLSVVPDYLSLTQTRFWIAFLARARSPLATAAVLCVNAAASALIALTALVIALFCIDLDAGATHLTWSDFAFDAREDIDLLFAGAQKPTLVPAWFWLATTMMTSVWLWIYLLAGGVIRGARGFAWLSQQAARLVDVGRKPFSALAVVLVAIVTIAYLVAIPFLLFLG